MKNNMCSVRIASIISVVQSDEKAPQLAIPNKTQIEQAHYNIINSFIYTRFSFYNN